MGGSGAGRAYRWVTAKLSTSTDVALSVHVIPAWQHKPRWEPSQDWLLFLITRPAISHAKRIFEVRLYILQQLPINGVAGEMATKRAEHIYIYIFNVCTLNRWNREAADRRGCDHRTSPGADEKKRIERFPSLSPPLRWNMLTATYLTCAEWMNGD